MRFNRSVPPCVVIPVLVYSDPGVAADWLAKAFGFTIRLRIANHRIQMKAGDGCFTIAEGNSQTDGDGPEFILGAPRRLLPGGGATRRSPC